MCNDMAKHDSSKAREETIEAIEEVKRMKENPSLGKSYSDVDSMMKELSGEQNIVDVTGAELSPGEPARCQGNGKHPDFECCCDECDFFLACYPEHQADVDEALEDLRDLRAYERAMEEYKKNPVTHSMDEVVKLLEEDDAEEERRREAWAFAAGLSKVDGLETSPEMKELIEREIRGEISTADIKKILDEKYAKKGERS